jgi:hypothetical protein
MARAPLDLYATPAEPALEICRLAKAQGIEPATIIEPSSGPGRFVAAALKVWPGASVIAADIDGAHRDACLAAGADVFIEGDWQVVAVRLQRETLAGPVLILGNPPFSRAQAHVEAALELLREGEHLVFLLRQSFRGSKERVAFWRRSPLLWTSTVVPRIPFTGEGGDMADCDVFCWRKGYRGRAENLPPMLWGTALAEDLATQDQLELVGRPA